MLPKKITKLKKKKARPHQKRRGCIGKSTKISDDFLFFPFRIRVQIEFLFYFNDLNFDYGIQVF